MILFRIAARRYEQSWREAFSGEGSFRAGGRWSSPGTRLVYASSHLSLATLEVLVHCNRASFLQSRLALRFELPDGVIEQIPVDQLPEDWNSIPESVATQRIGDAWTASAAAAGLIVPSAVLPGGANLDEQNVVLNPAYPGLLDLISNVSLTAFDFDRRIAGLAGERAAG